jgi:hypothetical protein
MQIIDIILVICVFVLVKLFLFDKKKKDPITNISHNKKSKKELISNINHNKKSKKVKFNENIINLEFNKDQQCRRYYDERITKPLVPEFEKITVSENPTLQEVYDRHVVDYRKMVPDKQRLDNDNQIISTGAYGNANYTIDQVQYVDENSMNGGSLDKDLYGFDPDFSGNYSIF